MADNAPKSVSQILKNFKKKQQQKSNQPKPIDFEHNKGNHYDNAYANKPPIPMQGGYGQPPYHQSPGDTNMPMPGIPPGSMQQPSMMMPPNMMMYNNNMPFNSMRPNPPNLINQPLGHPNTQSPLPVPYPTMVPPPVPCPPPFQTPFSQNFNDSGQNQNYSSPLPPPPIIPSALKQVLSIPKINQTIPKEPKAPKSRRKSKEINEIPKMSPEKLAQLTKLLEKVTTKKDLAPLAFDRSSKSGSSQNLSNHVNSNEKPNTSKSNSLYDNIIRNQKKNSSPLFEDKGNRNSALKALADAYDEDLSGNINDMLAQKSAKYSKLKTLLHEKDNLPKINSKVESSDDLSKLVRRLNENEDQFEKSRLKLLSVTKSTGSSDSDEEIPFKKPPKPKNKKSEPPVTEESPLTLYPESVLDCIRSSLKSELKSINSKVAESLSIHHSVNETKEPGEVSDPYDYMDALISEAPIPSTSLKARLGLLCNDISENDDETNKDKTKDLASKLDNISFENNQTKFEDSLSPNNNQEKSTVKSHDNKDISSSNNEIESSDEKQMDIDQISKSSEDDTSSSSNTESGESFSIVSELIKLTTTAANETENIDIPDKKNAKPNDEISEQSNMKTHDVSGSSFSEIKPNNNKTRIDSAMKNALNKSNKPKVPENGRPRVTFRENLTESIDYDVDHTHSDESPNDFDEHVLNEQMSSFSFSQNQDSPNKNSYRPDLDSRIKMLFGFKNSDDENSPNKSKPLPPDNPNPPPPPPPQNDTKYYHPNERIPQSPNNIKPQTPVNVKLKAPSVSKPQSFGNPRRVKYESAFVSYGDASKLLVRPPSPFKSKESYHCWHKRTIHYRQTHMPNPQTYCDPTVRRVFPKLDKHKVKQQDESKVASLTDPVKVKQQDEHKLNEPLKPLCLIDPNLSSLNELRTHSPSFTKEEVFKTPEIPPLRKNSAKLTENNNLKSCKRKFDEVEKMDVSESLSVDMTPSNMVEMVLSRILSDLKESIKSDLVQSFNSYSEHISKKQKIG